MSSSYKNFKEFYPFYLSQHSHPICKHLHFIGLILVLLIVTVSVLTQKWILLLVAPIGGYGLAWVGHFFFEKNTPATFKYPLYSLMGDWVMFGEMLAVKIKKLSR